jgi:hypothetical protein
MGALTLGPPPLGPLVIGPLVIGALVIGALVIGARQGAPPAAAEAVPASGRVPDAAVDALIHTDQLQLISRGPDGAVAVARGHLDQAARTLGDDRSTLAGDLNVSRHAGRIQDSARATLGRDTTTQAVDVGVDGRAVAAVAVDRRQLQALAVGWYTGGASISPALAESLAAAQAAGTADTELSLVTRLTSATLRRDVDRARVAADQVTAARGAVGDARAELGDDVRIADHAAVIVAAAERRIRADTATVASASARLDAARTARAKVVASFERAEGAGPAPVPTILGPSVLTAAEMTAWFEASGDVAATSATIGALTTWYLSEGRAEGVRADIAFAQAVVETGAFDSLDAVALNNYAGVGHCDSCAAGLRFSSPLAGIRSQIQLLRTYADPTLTSADLPSPPPVASLAPQLQGVRGCCRTWNSLTGVWATDPQYGTIILAVYTEMLSFAVSQPVPAAG